MSPMTPADVHLATSIGTIALILSPLLIAWLIKLNRYF